MKINPNDLQYEYPKPDNTEGEFMRRICDITHVPTGIRVRGRGNTSEEAKLDAMLKLRNQGLV